MKSHPALIDLLGDDAIVGQRYRHYKGNEYTILTDAVLEWCPKAENARVIVYSDDKGNRWVRPRKEFFGMVEHAGEIIPRFEPIGARGGANSD